MDVNVTSLTRSGILDWLVQRVSAIIMAIYVIFFTIYFLVHPNLDYSSWRALFQNPFMRYFSFLFLLSLVLHAWVGIWTIFTDYVKCAKVRLFLDVIVILLLLFCLIWGIEILWGI